MADSTDKNMFSYETLRQGEDNILKIDCENNMRVPSIEDDEVYMSKAAEFLIENPGVTKIVFSQKRDYEYDYAQTSMVSEIAHLYNQLVKSRDVFSYENLKGYGEADKRYNEIHNAVFNMMKKDPVGCYVSLKRILRQENIALDKSANSIIIEGHKKYITLLQYILQLLDNTKLITILKPFMPGHKVGDREIYRKVFTPSIKPDFMFTKLMATYPKNAVELDSYTVGNTEVVIFELPDNIQYLYHITPPEFKLEEEEYELLDLARNIMA